jgi:hypothetical protein
LLLAANVVEGGIMCHQWGRIMTYDDICLMIQLGVGISGNMMATNVNRGWKSNKQPLCNMEPKQVTDWIGLYINNAIAACTWITFHTHKT